MTTPRLLLSAAASALFLHPSLLMAQHEEQPAPAEPAALCSGPGTWQVDGGDLLQTAVVKQGAALIFGKKDWRDYDLTVRGLTEKGTHGFKVMFHVEDARNYGEFAVGNYFNTGNDRAYVVDGNWGREDGNFKPGVLDLSKWHDVRLEVRGHHVRCFLDGVLQFDGDESRFDHGRIGLATWEAAVRFRDLHVTAPDGSRLWSGFAGILPSDAPAAVPPVASGEPTGPPPQSEARVTLSGHWMRDGDDLRQTDVTRENATLLLGDSSWDAYDLVVQGLTEKGTHGFRVLFHATDEANHAEFAIGHHFNTTSELSRVVSGKWSRAANHYKEQKIDLKRWHEVRLVVRKKHVKCFLDGGLVFVSEEKVLASGRIGLGTFDAGVRFRGLRVVDPEGRELLAGFPSLEQAPPAVIDSGAAPAEASEVKSAAPAGEAPRKGPDQSRKLFQTASSPWGGGEFHFVEGGVETPRGQDGVPPVNSLWVASTRLTRQSRLQCQIQGKTQPGAMVGFVFGLADPTDCFIADVWMQGTEWELRIYRHHLGQPLQELAKKRVHIAAEDVTKWWDLELEIDQKSVSFGIGKDSRVVYSGDETIEGGFGLYVSGATTAAEPFILRNIAVSGLRK